MSEIYDETIREYADYFDMSVVDAGRLFVRFLNLTYDEAKFKLNPWQRAFCLGVYRTVKLKSACRSSFRSRERWRDRAIELGSPPDLMTRVEVPPTSE